MLAIEHEVEAMNSNTTGLMMNRSIAGALGTGHPNPELVEAVEDGGGPVESVSKEIFAPYACKSLDRGQPHPGDISEALSLR